MGHILELYKNRDWLKEKYLVEKLSINSIAKICNCGYTTIWKNLENFNISRRSRGEGIHLALANCCKLTEEAKQWIDGELLGDGCLSSQSSYSANFVYGSKYEEYINYVSDVLKSVGIEKVGKIYKKYYEKLNCYTYSYRSRSYPELLPIRKRWYPNGKKIIPKDLKLTPLVLRQEMIGDGCLKRAQKGRSHIVLSTDGFPIKDVEWFIKELNKLGFKSARQPSVNRVYISAYSTKDFLDYIGKCPVDCYNYKWNLYNA